MNTLVAVRPCIFTILCLGLSQAAMGEPGRNAAPAAISEAQIADGFEVDRFSVQQLNVPWGANLAVAGGEVNVDAEVDGRAVTLLLQPHSMRSADFQVLVQVADGSLVEAPLPPITTWRGQVVEIDAKSGQSIDRGTAAASIINGRLTATMVLEDDELWVIQPMREVFENAAADSYLVYSQRDVRPGNWMCGADAPHFDVPVGDGGGIAGGGGALTAEIAFDADFEFYQLNGSSVNNTVSDIEAVMNSVESIYMSQVSISYIVTQIVVRSAPADPYTTSVPGTLLDQFRAYWNDFHYYVIRDVAHLMTGRDVDGSVIGIAWLSVSCTSPTAAYGLSQSRFTSNFASRVALTTHELGHNWSANHCNNDADCGIMCASLGGCSGNLTQFGNTPRNEILAWRNSHNCANVTPVPPNDLCSQARVINAGPNLVYTLFANTNNGPQEAACGISGTPQIYNDVWFRLLNQCTGNVTVSLCGASYDSRLAVYTGCPAGNGQSIACNDNSCGNAPQVTFWALSGTEYWIRVGGANGATGNATMNITCSAAPASDECETADLAQVGANAFNNTVATTDGPSEPGGCFAGSTQIDNDLWYKFVAPISGTATASLCGTSFDARVAAYLGCPTGSGQSLACNDNFCGNSPQITFPIEYGSLYRIRVGGANGAKGAGMMNLAFALPPCAADLAPSGGGDGQIDIDDLLMVVNGWGGCEEPCPPHCIGDADRDCSIDINDVLAIVNGWGACP